MSSGEVSGGAAGGGGVRRLSRRRRGRRLGSRGSLCGWRDVGAGGRIHRLSALWRLDEHRRILARRGAGAGAGIGGRGGPTERAGAFAKRIGALARPECVIFDVAKLVLPGAVLALQVKVLANCVVKDAHLAPVPRRVQSEA